MNSSPQTTTKPLLDPLHGFAEWWKSFKCLPKRKVHKQWCMAFWIRNNLSQKATHIMLYTAWRIEQEETMQFFPGPKPFLNAGGWDDWEPEPVKETAYEKTIRETLERDEGVKPMPIEVKQKIAELRGRVNTYRNNPSFG